MRLTFATALMLLTTVSHGIQIRELPPVQLQEDFDILRRAVEEAHGGLYRFTRKVDLDRTFAATKARLSRSMTSVEFAAILSEALAAIRDGHTRLEYDDATVKTQASAKMLPLRVSYERGRLVVTSNDTASDNRIQPGMEVVSINGRPAAAIVASILATLSPDGFIETGKAARLARSFAQLYWFVVEQTDAFVVVAGTADGRSVTTSVGGVTSAERSKNANPVNAAYQENAARLDGPRDTVSLSFPRGDAVGVLRVRAFDGEAFLKSLDQAFATLLEKRSTGLVLDLRGNGGGVDTHGAALVSHFMTTPFAYFDRIKVTSIKPSFATWKPSTFESLKAGTTSAPDGGFLVGSGLHPGVKPQQPGSNPFTGKVVVLADGGTFSTAADVCAQLRSRTEAIFIGEETGGTAEGNTSGLNAQISLPHSGLKLKVNMYGYWNALGAAPRGGAQVLPPGRGVQPDVTVVRTVADTLRGNDSALEQALARLR